MKTRKMTTYIIGVSLLFASCAKDNPYNTPHPDKGAVQITTDWSGASSDAVLPQSYVLRIGTLEQTVSGTSNVFNTLFEPGSQDLLVCHPADGVTLNGTTASVNTLADGTLEPMPGYLFSGTQELDIVKDDTLKVTVKMQQRIRILTLALGLNPGDDERIAGTSAMLTGIASSIDLKSGAVTEGKNMVPAFTIGTSGAERTRSAGAPALTVTLRLLGVMPAKQQVLTLNLSLTDGSTHTITSDLSEALKNFAEKMEPLELDTTLKLPVEAGVSATITGWKEVDNGDVDIH